jgi:hypothetical protein
MYDDAHCDVLLSSRRVCQQAALYGGIFNSVSLYLAISAAGPQ